MKLFSIDLKLNENNYSSFSGWFISKNNISSNQINTLISTLKEDFQYLNLKSLDGDGEDLEDYCDEFKYFDLEKIDNHSIVCLDLNCLEEFEPDIPLSNIFLCNKDGKVIVFHNDGNFSLLK